MMRAGPPPPAPALAPQVYWCCCFPQGPVTLDCRFDKAAYAAGETAQIACKIDNDSSCDVRTMAVKLMRFITLTDGKGHRTSTSDCLAVQNYDGVPRKSSAGRQLPLPLSTSAGGFLSSIKSKNIEIRYQLEVEAQIDMAFDVSRGSREDAHACGGAHPCRSVVTPRLRGGVPPH